MKAAPVIACVLVLFGIASAKPNPVPMIYQPTLPLTVKPGSGQFTLTINGTGFAAGAAVTWNGVTRVTSVISGSQVQAQINASDVSNPGTFFVNVINPSPGGGASNTILFPVQTPAPYVPVSQASTFSGSGVNLAADFNNDGFIDLQVSDENGGGFLVDTYLGNGDGTFQAVHPNHVVLPVKSMIAGSFSKHPFPDVSTLDGIGNAAILTNHSGAFILPHFMFRSPTLGQATGDFNRDGNLDLVVTGFYTQNGDSLVNVSLNHGDATFDPPSNIFRGRGRVGIPAVGDFDGDGKLDIAVPFYAYTDNVYIFLGNGDGTFQAYKTYSVASPPSLAAVADVNDDGFLDIITDGGALLGRGDGTFSTGSSIQPNSESVLAPPFVGDFNGDGKLDFLVGFSLLLGNGDGTFQNPVQLSQETGSTVVVGDFNNDGKLDVVGKHLYLQIPLVLSPSSLDFGNQKVGTKSKPQNVTVLNDGGSDLSITGIGFTGNDPHDFSQVNNCPASLPVGSSCQVAAVFKPKTGGPRSASLEVNFQGVGSPQTVAVSGTGSVSTVTLQPAQLSFALQLVGTASHPKAATLTNTGTVAVNISEISTKGPFSQTNNCPSSLPVNSNCEIQVTFSPVNKGLSSGELSVTDDAEGSPQKVSLSGKGTVISVSPLSINFGNQNVGTKSSPAPVTMKNVGTNSVNISQIAIGGKDAGDFSQSNNCGHSLAGGATCTIQATFTPLAKGKRSASLEVTDNGGGSPQKVALTGTGT